MDLIEFKPGGQPFYNRDFKHQQESIMKAIELQYSGLGAFVVSGCGVTGSDVARGLVYCDGKILEFSGANNVSFPIYIKSATPRQYEERFFPEDNQNKTTRIDYYADYVGTQPSSGEYITVSANGAEALMKPTITKGLTTITLNPTQSNFTGTLKFRKVGLLVEMFIDITYTSNAGGFNQIVCTIDESIRPSLQVNFTTQTVTAGIVEPGSGSVESSGNVYFFQERNNSDRTVLHLVYLLP